MKYKPDQSARDTLKVAKVHGIKIYQTIDRKWAWSLRVKQASFGVGAMGFNNKYEAAQDALIGLITIHKNITGQEV